MNIIQKYNQAKKDLKTLDILIEKIRIDWFDKAKNTIEQSKRGDYICCKKCGANYLLESLKENITKFKTSWSSYNCPVCESSFMTHAEEDALNENHLQRERIWKLERKLLKVIDRNFKRIEREIRRIGWCEEITPYSGSERTWWADCEIPNFFESDKEEKSNVINNYKKEVLKIIDKHFPETFDINVRVRSNKYCEIEFTLKDSEVLERG